MVDYNTTLKAFELIEDLKSKGFIVDMTQVLNGTWYVQFDGKFRDEIVTYTGEGIKFEFAVFDAASKIGNIVPVDFSVKKQTKVLSLESAEVVPFNKND